MTKKTSTKDPVADVFAALDAAQAAPAADAVAKGLGDAKGRALADAILADKAAGAPRPARPMGPPAELPADAKGRKPRTAAELAREAIALRGPGHARHQLPLTAQGRLDGDLAELVGGRSRRYAQDLEAWARASLADVNRRGVLVVWDGPWHSIKLDGSVPAGEVQEVTRQDLAGWRADAA